MKHIIVFISLLFFVSCTPSKKVLICHKNGPGKYVNVEIKENALDDHLAHGDGFPGEEVPDMPGYIFTGGCDCIKKPFECGQVLADDDGNEYETVQIGGQCWMKENLNIGAMIPGAQDQADDGSIEKYCYDNDEINCDIYGGLYQWNEAMMYSTDAGAKGICPDGWHIPTKAELEILVDEVCNKIDENTWLNSNALKAVGQGTGNGAGTNTSGFSALLGAYRYTIGDNFSGLGGGTYFWTSSLWNESSSYNLGMISSDDNLGFDHAPNYFGFSIRCLKD